MKTLKTLAAIAAVLFLVQGPGIGQTFLRGDADSNRRLELSDAIRILTFLFLGGEAPGCLDAADADDNGTVEMTDGIRILGFLFLGQRGLPPPFAAAGTDPTPDRLTCRAPSPGPGPRASMVRLPLDGTPGANVLSVKSGDGTEASSDMDGVFVISIGAAGSGGSKDTRTVVIDRVSLAANGVRAGTPGETGAFTIVRDSKGVSKGSFDPATGALSAIVALQVSYDAMLKFPDKVVNDGDVRNMIQPLHVEAQLSGKLSSSGVLAGKMTLNLPADAAVIASAALDLSFQGPWSAEDLQLDPNLQVAHRFDLKIAIVAADASGTGAVISPEEVTGAIAHANEIWSQCCVQFLAYPEAAGGITHVPANAFKGGDGDLFAVDDACCIGGSDEEEFLWDHDPDPDAIEVVFVERFVVDGTDTFTAGATTRGGTMNAAIIVEVEKLTPEWVGRVLAHELGHALGIADHSSIKGNLMAPQLAELNPTITGEQCEEARTDSPLPQAGGPCQ